MRITWPWGDKTQDADVPLDGQLSTWAAEIVGVKASPESPDNTIVSILFAFDVDPQNGILVEETFGDTVAKGSTKLIQRVTQYANQWIAEARRQEELLEGERYRQEIILDPTPVLVVLDVVNDVVP